LNYDIKDENLAERGKLRVEWAANNMPVLKLIRERFREEKPLAGTRLSACLHVTTETANLMVTLKEGGAECCLCASNPLSTQDDVAAYLVREQGISVFAVRGEDNDTYYDHIREALAHRPTVTMDDGADLVSALHFLALGKLDQLHPSVAGWAKNELSKEAIEELVAGVAGSTEETTTGVIRLKGMAAEGILQFPVVAVNDSLTKHLFDNRYGTGQSTLDGILRATNCLFAGSTLVVSGYGWCGRGIATRARGMGANVIICEVDALKALEATMDGFRVMPAVEAAPIGDIFVTVTGDIRVIAEESFRAMKDGAIVCNSGHFNVEIDIEALERMSTKRRTVRDFVEEFTLEDGRRIYLLGEGRLINLTAAEGHPAMVMDMSFANQALGAEYLVQHHEELPKAVHKVPDDIDEEVARLKLKSMGIEIDRLTPEQEEYLASWEIGT
jgi:adenosylhomocysteinase